MNATLAFWTIVATRIASAAVLLLVIALLRNTGKRAFGDHPTLIEILWFLFWGLAINRLWYVGKGAWFSEVPGSYFELGWAVAAAMFAFALWSTVIVLWHRSNRPCPQHS